MAQQIVDLSNWRYTVNANYVSPNVIFEIDCNLLIPGPGDSPDLSYREWTARLFRMTTPEVIHELGSHSGYVMMNDRSYRQFNNIALEGSLYVDVNFYQPGTGAVEASPRLYVNW